jgi:molecular chaperone DnaK (HSP70)
VVCRQQAHGRPAVGHRGARPLEAGTEHPGARTLIDKPAVVVGIDLGTTNSALAWSDRRGPVRISEIPQLVAPGEIASPPSLPSFLYATEPAERASGAVRLPWNAAPDFVAGVFARDEGALVPARQVASAKSWLSNAHVDRTAPLLPWGAESGTKISPVEASTRLLAHLRDAWDSEHAAADESRRLARQSVVLTVPASFDEEGRELTVQAGRAAGLENLTLLEEPLAALYAWIAANRGRMADVFGGGALILVCDVGGGTTDFSLIRSATAEGELTFERIAIGEHLLLGGDNLDLALAVLVEQRLGDAQKLSLAQRLSLRRKCSAAKERLLEDAALERLPITILGTGRGVVGSGRTAELTRTDVLDALTAGFLPITPIGDLPARDRRAGLRELGLPYETEPAITRHLAAFLTRAGQANNGAPPARPDAVLFNGGFFKPAVARARVLDALAAWFGEKPRVIENDSPESAVAVGAAFYGRLRSDPGAPRRLLIRAGSGRAYYIGIETGNGSAEPAAVCVLPRGTDEGTRIPLDHTFTVLTNRPAAFTLFSTTARADQAGAVVTLGSADEVIRHAPLVTALRYGKRSRRVPLAIGLSATFTETGTLEIWCESRTSEHRWRLAFNLRGIEADPLDDSEEDGHEGAPEVVVPEAAVNAAAELLREVFTHAPGAPAPEAAIGDLEGLIGHGKQAWPLGVIRKLADVLLEHEAGRRISPRHEVRWLNLAGFCARPGFGSALDTWRVSELRKVYASGLAFPKEIQNQVEWLVLWQRVGAGFTAGQQRELAQRVSGQIGLGQKKPPRLNPQIERESWRLLATLERLDASHRAKLGEALLEKVRREPRNASWLWALGRCGARLPLYGPLNTVVGADVAEAWIERLLSVRELTPDVAAAVAQIGAATGDPARDISPAAAEAAATRLLGAGFDGAAERLRHVIAADRAEAGRVFGEALPEGLRLDAAAATDGGGS